MIYHVKCFYARSFVLRNKNKLFANERHQRERWTTHMADNIASTPQPARSGFIVKLYIHVTC